MGRPGPVVGHQEAPVVQTGDDGSIAATVVRRADAELAADRQTLGIVAPPDDPVAGPILAGGMPGDHIAAVRQGRHLRIDLLSARPQVHLILVPQRLASGVK